MTKTEAMILATFCNELNDRFSNDGCNEMTLPDTPENRELVNKATQYAYGDDVDMKPHIEDGEICTGNEAILSYLTHRLMVEHGITEDELEDFE